MQIWERWMEDERLGEKLAVVAVYLRRELAMPTVVWIEDTATMDYVFRVDDEQGVPRYRLRIGRNTLDDHPVAEIEPILER